MIWALAYAAKKLDRKVRSIAVVVAVVCLFGGFMVGAVVFDATDDEAAGAATIAVAPHSWDVSVDAGQRYTYMALALGQACPQIREVRDRWVIGVAVGIAESGGRPEAFNDNPATGDLSYGLFQINMIITPTQDLGTPRRVRYGIAANEELFDPAVNAKAACMESGGGVNWLAWSTYTRYEFQDHMAEAELAVTAAESGRQPSTFKEFDGTLLPGSDGLQPEFARRLAALASATAQATGGTAFIKSGYRSLSEQIEIIGDGPCGVMVACASWENGCSSFHCQGVAADMGWSNDTAFDYWHAHAREYAIRAPMSWEDWHFEPVETRGGADAG